MEPDRDTPSAGRRKPSGRSATAKSATTRRAAVAVAPAEEAAPVEESHAEASPVEDTAVDAGPADTEEPAAAPSATPKTSRPASAKKPTSKAVAARPPRAALAAPGTAGSALVVRGLTKRFGEVVAVDTVDLDVPTGTFYGFVGPNGAGKTTTLAMITGLLRPDAGVVTIHGVDVWRNPAVAKKSLGVLPDQLRLFDRLTGAEFLHHAGALRGLGRDTIAHRVDDLSAAFGLRHSLDRFVSDFSAGMIKKIAIAAAMIHSPRLLVLDEPFESVDPVSANAVIGILKKYAQAGGTVLLSSHSMSLIERTCDSVAIIAEGRMLAAGPLDEVLAGETLETRFVELAGGATAVEGMEWLQSYSD